MKVRLMITLVISVGLAVLCGCAGPKVYYAIEPPEIETLPISGIPADCYVVELTDQCGTAMAHGDTLLLVTEQEDERQTCYELSLSTGQARELLDIADPRPTYFWNTHSVSGMDAGQECGGICASATPFGGTLQKFGFEGRKELVSTGLDSLIFITSYQYQRDERVTWTSWCVPYAPYQQEVSTSVGRTIKFLKGSEVIEITSTKGYYWSANIRARAYAISDRLIVAQVPDSVEKPSSVTNVFAFDLEQKTSHGAEYRFEKKDQVIDFGIAPDKSAAVFLIIRNDDLYMVRTDPYQLNIAAKAFVTRGN